MFLFCDRQSDGLFKNVDGKMDGNHISKYSPTDDKIKEMLQGQENAGRIINFEAGTDWEPKTKSCLKEEPV